MEKLITYRFVDSPIGRLLLTAQGPFLSGLFFEPHEGPPIAGAEARPGDEPFAAVAAQLEAYFAGRLQEFEVALQLAGTPFQRRVWNELVRIPFGVTLTYAQLAARIGQSSAVRAVGHANARNPVAIIVPCHRVIGTDGSLVGYGGGLERKRWLLDLERNRSAAEYRSQSPATTEPLATASAR